MKEGKGKRHTGTLGDGKWTEGTKLGPFPILFTPSPSLSMQATEKLPGAMIPLHCLKKPWAGGTQDTALDSRC